MNRENLLDTFRDKLKTVALSASDRETMLGWLSELGQAQATPQQPAPPTLINGWLPGKHKLGVYLGFEYEVHYGVVVCLEYGIFTASINTGQKWEQWLDARKPDGICRPATVPPAVEQPVTDTPKPRFPHPDPTAIWVGDELNPTVGWRSHYMSADGTRCDWIADGYEEDGRLLIADCIELRPMTVSLCNAYKAAHEGPWSIV